MCGVPKNGSLTPQSPVSHPQTPPPFAGSLKRVKQTDAIFDHLKAVNPEADRAHDTLRVAIDAQATVHVGPFSRRGKSRTGTEAADHDSKPVAALTPLASPCPSTTTCGCTWRA